MEPAPAKHEKDSVHVFAMRRGYQIAGVLFALFIISIWPALCLFMAVDNFQMLLSPVMLIAHVVLMTGMFLLGLMTYFAFASTRLVIGPERIEYYTFGYTIATSWNNLAGIGPMPGVLTGTEALLLREPVTRLSGWYQTFKTVGPALSVAARASGRYYSGVNEDMTGVIPVSPFDLNWQKGPIGELVRRFAPHVFNPESAPARGAVQSDSLYEEVARRSRPRPWRTVAAFAGYVALAGLAVMLVARVQTSQLKATLTGSTDSIRVLAFSPDGKLLASGDSNKTVRLWDLGTNKQRAVLQAPSGISSALAFRPDGKVVATGNSIWEVESGKELASLKGHENIINSVAFTPDGKLLASGAYGPPGVLLWDATALSNDAKPVAALASHFSKVKAVAFSPDAKLLAVGAENGAVEIWDVAAREVKFQLPADGTYDSIHTLAYTPDGRWLARLNFGGEVYIYDANNYETAPFEAMRKWSLDAKASSIAFSADNRFVALGCRDKKVRVVRVPTGEKLLTFPGHNFEVQAVAFSPDGKTLASGDGSSDPPVRIFLWDTSSLGK